MDFIARNIDGELYVSLDQVNKAIEEKNAEIENIKATHYSEMVDAGMRERKLKRAFYKACAMWADRTRLICSVFGSNAPKIRWERMHENCLVKARKYK
jgi:hypothetical protein